jgi:erythromycin esterase
MGRYVRRSLWSGAGAGALAAVTMATRPDTEEMGRYARRYLAEMADKAPYIDHARQVYALVDGLPHSPGDRAHALALHHARQIVSFYEHFALPDNSAYRDDRAPQNLRWWHDHSGDKVAYWAASAHTADAPDLAIAAPAVRS